jgi:hypothetical protein
VQINGNKILAFSKKKQKNFQNSLNILLKIQDIQLNDFITLAYLILIQRVQQIQVFNMLNYVLDSIKIYKTNLKPKHMTKN